MPADHAPVKGTAWGRFARALKEFEDVMDLSETDILAARLAKLEDRLARVEAQLKENTNV